MKPNEKKLLNETLQRMESNFQAVEIIGVYWVGATMRIVIATPEQFFGNIYPSNIGNKLVELLQKTYPILHFNKRFGMYDVIWGNENEMESLFVYHNKRIDFINVDNPISELLEVKAFFKSIWEKKTASEAESRS